MSSYSQFFDSSVVGFEFGFPMIANHQHHQHHHHRVGSTTGHVMSSASTEVLYHGGNSAYNSNYGMYWQLNNFFLSFQKLISIQVKS
jgi:hypothetical protein